MSPLGLLTAGATVGSIFTQEKCLNDQCGSTCREIYRKIGNDFCEKNKEDKRCPKDDAEQKVKDHAHRSIGKVEGPKLPESEANRCKCNINGDSLLDLVCYRDVPNADYGHTEPPPAATPPADGSTGTGNAKQTEPETILI